MATLRQRTAFGPGVYRGHKFDKDRLKRFVDGTNKAIAAGVPVPLLKRHAPINASDDETLQFAKEEGAGFLTKVELEDDGAIAWEAKDVPDDVVKQSTEGTLRFTSPEFRETYECEKAGVYTGPIIRHFGFTPKPGNPHQGAIEAIALQELPDKGCFQFAEEERQPLQLDEDELPPKKKEALDVDPEPDAEAKVDPEKGKQPEAEVNTPPEPPKEPINPDMPPKATDRTKVAAVLAGLNQKGIVLPSDFCFDGDASIDILLAAINSSIKAENEAESDKEPEGEDESPTDAPMPFSEEELAALPPKARKALEASEAARIKAEGEAKANANKAAQFEEEQRALKNNQARDKAKQAINTAKIPPSLRGKLLERFEATEGAVQFTEGTEQALFTPSQVAELVASCVPGHLVFEEKNVAPSIMPKSKRLVGYNDKGEPVWSEANAEAFFEKEEDMQPYGHVSPERANEIANQTVGKVTAQQPKPWMPVAPNGNGKV